MKKQLKSLNVLKGIGILMIIMVHNRHFIMKDMSGLRQLINYGQMGCQLFFMVSGMALCYSWYHLTSKYTGLQETQLTFRQRILCSGQFILRRYLRLAPGFLIILCINYMLNVLFMDVLDHSPGFIVNREPAAILTNLLFLHGFFPDYINNVFPGGWYIGTTFILYALFPLLILLFEKLYSLKRHSILIIPVIFLALNCVLLRNIANTTHNALYPYNNSFLYYFFTNQLPCFSLGIMLYFQEKTGFSAKCPLPVSILLSAVTCFVSIRLYLMPEQNFIYSVIPSLVGLSYYWLAVSFIHIELCAASPEETKDCGTNLRAAESSQHAARRIIHPFTDFIASCGSNSYGMYLVHAFVSWYGLKDLSYFLTQGGYTYNDLLLYCALYLPTVFVIYVLGLYMAKLLDIIDKKLRPSG
ncbi:MAG: acyltransferase [Lachnospiraceae bacterium]|nr:acyltransferase [Lachnospiraceae bacterium]